MACTGQEMAAHDTQRTPSSARAWRVAATEPRRRCRGRRPRSRRLEAFAVRVLGRIADAEIEGEAGEEDAREAALAQVAGEPGRRLAIVFIEGRVGVDLAVIALAQDQLGMGNVAGPA